MVNFVEDPEQRWSEIESKLNTDAQHLSILRYTYDEWLRLYNLCVRTHGTELHDKIDDAFRRLNDLTIALLCSTDEDINAHEDNPSKTRVLSAVECARDGFRCLSSTSENGLRQVGKFSQEAFRGEYDSVHFGDDLESFEGVLQRERLQAESTRCGYENETSSAWSELRSIDDRLREYDDMSGFEQFFNSNPHDAWDGRRRDQQSLANDWQNKLERMYRFETRIQDACRKLQDLRRENTILFDRNVKDEIEIIDAKEIAADVYNKLRDMENYVISTEVKLGIEDALRHVLKLTYVSVKMVDEDVHVKEFKGMILGSIADKYGQDKTEELKQDRQYIDPFEI